MTIFDCGKPISKICTFAGVALTFVAVVAVEAAPKKPDGAKQHDIPLPEMAPWHKRPAALGKGPNALTAAATKANPTKSSKKTVSNKAAAKAEEVPPSVTTLLAEDPNEWPDEDINENLKACVAQLASIQARVEISKPFRNGACGAPAAVEVKKVGTRYPITLSPPATLRCDMAASLYRFVEFSLQPAAVALLGSPIASFNEISTYSCRNRYGDPGGKLSEHALANALDVGKFRLVNGKTIKVLTDWGPTKRDVEKATDSVVEPVAVNGKKAKTAARNGRVQLASLDGQELSKRQLQRLNRQGSDKTIVVPPAPIKKSDAVKMPDIDKAAPSTAGTPVPAKKPTAKQKNKKVVAKAPAPPKVTKEMRFLKRIHSEACQYFGTVLGPEANDAHRNHFHFDMAPRKRSNYCR